MIRHWNSRAGTHVPLTARELLDDTANDLEVNAAQLSEEATELESDAAGKRKRAEELRENAAPLRRTSIAESEGMGEV